MPVSAEGRVEHQKLNQPALRDRLGKDFGVQPGLRLTKALINPYDVILIH